MRLSQPFGILHAHGTRPGSTRRSSSWHCPCTTRFDHDQPSAGMRPVHAFDRTPPGLGLVVQHSARRPCDRRGTGLIRATAAGSTSPRRSRRRRVARGRSPNLGTAGFRGTDRMVTSTRRESTSSDRPLPRFALVTGSTCDGPPTDPGDHGRPDGVRPGRHRSSSTRRTSPRQRALTSAVHLRPTRSGARRPRSARTTRNRCNA